MLWTNFSELIHCVWLLFSQFDAVMHWSLFPLVTMDFYIQNTGYIPIFHKLFLYSYFMYCGNLGAI